MHVGYYGTYKDNLASQRGAGQSAIYEEMSSVLFVNGYLTVMAEELEEVKSHMLRHLQELMADEKAYGWTCIISYHAAWLQQ